MGLASAMNTALTGMSASETVIGVIGNNLANADTAGFKASDANFATQFLQTQTIGSTPSADNYGTNPVQTGLGALVSSITPNFTQGTIQTANSPTDLAIQGNGFFTVTGSTPDQNLYTRDGVFQLNANNVLTTSSGNAVKGWGVTDYVVNTGTDPVPISIPLGTAQVAQQTTNVALSGSLSPTGTVATLSQVLQSGFIGDASYAAPTNPVSTQFYTDPTAEDASGTATNATGGTNSSITNGLADGEYSYELVAVNTPTANQTLPASAETVYTPITASVSGSTNDDGEVTLNNLPTPAAGATLALYRADVTNGVTGTYKLANTFSAADIASNGGTYVDQVPDSSLPASPAGSLNIASTFGTTLTGTYSYYTTYVNTQTGQESAPSPMTGSAFTVSGQSIEVTNLPQLPDASSNTYEYNAIRIYRNASDGTSFYQVGQINDPKANSTFVDNVSDTDLTQNAALNMNGPAITADSFATNMTQGGVPIFTVGDTLQFTADVGGTTVATPSMTIAPTTTVQDVMTFMQEALGIQMAPGTDPSNKITADSSGYKPNVTMTNTGQLQVVSNTGTANAVSIGATALQITGKDGTTSNLDMNFNTVQTANGASAATDFVAYTDKGAPLNVHLTTVLQGISSNGNATYRWYADCPTNIGANGNVNTAVGTGIITFDSTGAFDSASNSQVTIQGAGADAGTVSFSLDFSQISGLAASSDSLTVASVDGSAPGSLTSFTISQDGTINGVFTNGLTRTLGQIVLTPFNNPAGLEAQGNNLYAAGVNSNQSTPKAYAPGTNGTGTIAGGATELSNTDVGSNLVDLILASTMYQSNSQVITTANTLFSDLLTLVRNG
jgi:flagellar hook protein FlgE